MGICSFNRQFWASFGGSRVYGDLQLWSAVLGLVWWEPCLWGFAALVGSDGIRLVGAGSLGAVSMGICSFAWQCLVGTVSMGICKLWLAVMGLVWWEPCLWDCGMWLVGPGCWWVVGLLGLGFWLWLASAGGGSARLLVGGGVLGWAWLGFWDWGWVWLVRPGCWWVGLGWVWLVRLGCDSGTGGGLLEGNHYPTVSGSRIHPIYIYIYRYRRYHAHSAEEKKNPPGGGARLCMYVCASVWGCSHVCMHACTYYVRRKGRVRMYVIVG